MQPYLQRKGWSTEEISRVRVTFRKLDKERTAKHRLIDSSIFLLLLAFSVCINAVLAILLIPLFWFFPVAFLGMILIVGGLAFGLPFAYLSRDLKGGQGLFIASSAVLTLLIFGMVFKGANEAEQLVGRALKDTFLFAALFVLSYITPFTVVHPGRRLWT